MSDPIRPEHYGVGKDYEPKDVIRAWNLGFNLGNVVKYISRAGKKDDIVQDLRKAKQYLEFEIEAIEAERKGTRPVYDEDVNEEPKEDSKNLCDSCVYPHHLWCPSYGEDAKFSGEGVTSCKHYRKGFGVTAKVGETPKSVILETTFNPFLEDAVADEVAEQMAKRFVETFFGG